MRRAALAAAAAVALLPACVPSHAETWVTVDHSTDRPLVDGRFESALLPTSAMPGADGGMTCDDAGMPMCREAWDAFPARVHLTMRFPPLGHDPVVVQAFLAFDAGGHGAGPSFGDSGRVEALDPVTSSVTLYNATEQDYFVRVVVE